MVGNVHRIIMKNLALSHLTYVSLHHHISIRFNILLILMINNRLKLVFYIDNYRFKFPILNNLEVYLKVKLRRHDRLNIDIIYMYFDVFWYYLYEIKGLSMYINVIATNSNRVSNGTIMYFNNNCMDFNGITM
jgi:hypothetical protein